MVRPFTLKRFLTVTMATLLAVTVPACSRQEEISVYEEPDSETAESVRDFATKPASTAPTVQRLAYETPEGWLQGKVGGMRKAAFRVEKEGKRIDVTAIDLAASAGALLPNINRWRQQIQLGEITQEEMEESISDIEVAGVPGHYVEIIGFEGAERRQAILGVVAIRGNQAWFFKLWGDMELALQEKQRFREFAESVKFEAPKSDGSKVTSKAEPRTVPEGSQPLKYTAPEGWTPAKVGGMRKAAFRVNEGEQAVEITAIDLSAAAGGLLPNVNRWRGQIKLKEMTQEELDAQLRPIQVAAEQGHYVELIGPKDAERPLAILGAVVLHQDRAWFFKMIGDAELALRERERFEGFVKSVAFAAKDGDDND